MRFTARMQARIDARDQTLGGGFLVSGGAVDLASEEQTAHRSGFQPRMQTSGIKVVVLDSVARPRNARALEARMERTISSCVS